MMLKLDRSYDDVKFLFIGEFLRTRIMTGVDLQPGMSNGKDSGKIVFQTALRHHHLKPA